MLTIQLDPELETALINLAQKEHLSPNDMVKQVISHYIEQQSTLLVDVVKDLPEIACFKNQKPLEIQKALRDEWN